MDRWCQQWNQPRGGMITLEQGWGLGAWYADRLDPGWERSTVDEAQAFFARLGLTSPFWSLK